MDQDYEHGEEIEIEAVGIEVSSQPIELYKVFKIANLVGGGGEAKHLIAEGYVAVNGELETRKRRKMYDGDFFEFNQEYYVVVCEAPVTQETPKPVNDIKPSKAQKQTKQKQANKTTSKQNNESDGPTAKKKSGNGRSSIDFF